MSRDTAASRPVVGSSSSSTRVGDHELADGEALLLATRHAADHVIACDGLRALVHAEHRQKQVNFAAVVVDQPRIEGLLSEEFGSGRHHTVVQRELQRLAHGEVCHVHIALGHERAQLLGEHTARQLLSGGEAVVQQLACHILVIAQVTSQCLQVGALASSRRGQHQRHSACGNVSREIVEHAQLGGRNLAEHVDERLGDGRIGQLLLRHLQRVRQMIVRERYRGRIAPAVGRVQHLDICQVVLQRGQQCTGRRQARCELVRLRRARLLLLSRRRRQIRTVGNILTRSARCQLYRLYAHRRRGRGRSHDGSKSS